MTKISVMILFCCLLGCSHMHSEPICARWNEKQELVLFNECTQPKAIWWWHGGESNT